MSHFWRLIFSLQKIDLGNQKGVFFFLGDLDFDLKEACCVFLFGHESCHLITFKLQFCEFFKVLHHLTKHEVFR